MRRRGISRRLVWLLFGLTLALVPVVIVLGAVGKRRGLDLPPTRGSELWIELMAAVAATLFAVVGVLIARNQPTNAIGSIFLGSALAMALMGSAYGYADLVLYGREDWPGGVWAAWFASWSFIVPVFAAPCFVAQLFPHGTPLSERWRIVLRVSVGLVAYLALAPALGGRDVGSYPGIENPAALPAWAAKLVVDPTWGLDIFVFLGLSLASVVVRFRRSRGVERQQIKWLGLAGCVVIVGYASAFALGSALPSPWQTVFFIAGISAFLLMPVAVVIAILRYRLYDIERLVSRALVYGVLTAFLGGAYAGLVLAGQAVFSSFAGGSNLAVAVSTLAVAALFLPARARIRRFVDRRFYRRRYDAQRTLQGFGARLRNQVDLDGLRADLVGAVEETMEPSHVALWLRREGSS